MKTQEIDLNSPRPRRKSSVLRQINTEFQNNRSNYSHGTPKKSQNLDEDTSYCSQDSPALTLFDTISESALNIYEEPFKTPTKGIRSKKLSSLTPSPRKISKSSLFSPKKQTVRRISNTTPEKSNDRLKLSQVSVLCCREEEFSKLNEILQFQINSCLNLCIYISGIFHLL